jgi:hypothetical protein
LSVRGDIQDVFVEEEPHVIIAREICAVHGLDWDSLHSSQKRAILCFWCSGCEESRKLTELQLTGRSKTCVYCGEKVKLHATSKLTKIRRAVFYRMIEQIENKKGRLSMLFPIPSMLFPIPSMLFPIPSMLFPIPSMLLLGW